MLDTGCLFCGELLNQEDAESTMGVMTCPKCKTPHMLFNEIKAPELDPYKSDVIIDRFASWLDVDMETLDRYVCEYKVLVNLPHDLRYIFVAFWNPKDTYTTSEIADMLDISVGWAGKKAAKGEFGEVNRAQVTRRTYGRGRWLIPRGDRQSGLYSYLHPSTISLKRRGAYALSNDDSAILIKSYVEMLRFTAALKLLKIGQFGEVDGNMAYTFTLRGENVSQGVAVGMGATHRKLTAKDSQYLLSDDTLDVVIFPKSKFDLGEDPIAGINRIIFELD